MAFRAGLCLAALLFLSCPAFSQSIVVASPTASQTLSGTSFTFAASLSALPKVVSVEWFVNGVSQGIVWSAPWSLAWNTNDIYNSSSAWHSVYAVARGALGNTLATSAPVNFGIYNAYLEPSSTLSCGAITTSTPLTSSWSGTVNLTVPFTGTNASNQKTLYALVDGDFRVYGQTNQSTTNLTVPVKTTMFPNGPHILTFLPRDAQSTAGTANGYPFCQWEQQVTFNNGSGTAMELLVSPKEWVIAPGATQQLSPIIDNTDGTTQAAGAPGYSSGNTAVCTVNSSGLVTGVAYGTCPIIATSGSYSRTIYGYVASTNVVPHFGSDGQLHSTYTPGVSLWFASIFQATPNTSFADPFHTDAQYGIPYTQAGYNVYETTPLNTNTMWGTSQSGFQSAVTSFISSAVSPLNTYNLYLHAVTTSLVSGCGGSPGPNCGTGSSPLYSGTRGICSTYSTPCWTYLAAQWMATNRLLGFSGPDESDANYLYPSLGTGVLGSTGAPSQITCVTSAPTTWNVAWPSPGPDISGPNGFIIVGATTHSQLNNTIGGSVYINANVVYGSGFSFTGPSCASGNVTVTSATDPGLTFQIFAYEWDNNNTDYVHNTDYATIPTQIHAGGSVVTGPVRGLASVSSQKGWMGNCSSPPTWGDYAEVYETADNSAYSHPQHAWVVDLRTPGGIALGPNIRAFWGNMCAPRAMLSISQGTPLDYGIQGPTIAINTIAGSLVTFAAPHNVSVIFTSISRATISGSSNAYFNGNVFIDDCPTSVTCDISLGTPSAMPPNTPNPGTVTFEDGSSFTNVEMSATGGSLSCSGGGTCSGANMNLKQNMTFTYSGSAGANAYYTSNTFRLRSCPIPTACNSSELFWREVPPSSQLSGGASAVVYANSSYIKGVNLNAGEDFAGFNYPFASVFYAALLGSAGHRLYQAGADYTLGTLTGNGLLTFGSTQNYTVQAGASPIYDNGETTAVGTFWATASANLFLQRFATTGYLFQPRFGAPDIGYNIESSLRKGSKGNLLLSLNLQDGPQTRTVDLSNCAVSGQPTIRYTVNYQAIAISTLSAGVTTDTPTYPASGAVVYLCSNNAGNEYNPPTISARLADVPGATQIVVRYSHVAYELPQTTNNAVNCGTGTCALPVDRQIGPIYYRLYYLNSSGAVLAASDVQTL